jgi:3-hydroxyisobutyrate dehydrogenase
MEFLSDTSGGPNVLKNRRPTIAATLNSKDPGPLTFDIDLVCEDLRTMIAEAKARGASLPLAERTLAIYDDAVRAGWSKPDGSWLRAYWPAHGQR